MPEIICPQCKGLGIIEVRITKKMPYMREESKCVLSKL